MYFFVYGTLKLAHPNSYLLIDSSEYVGDGVTVDLEWSLYTNGAFPMAHYGGGLHGIFGQVWTPKEGNEESVMSRLDFLESYPGLYNREEIPVQTQGIELDCWMYYMRDTPNHPQLVRGVF